MVDVENEYYTAKCASAPFSASDDSADLPPFLLLRLLLAALSRPYLTRRFAT